MKQLLSTLSKLATRQKLMLLIILLALAPVVGMIVWGVNKAVQSPEFQSNNW